MQAVILAGGLGTRLRPVLPDKPKVMASVARKPVLEHLLVALARQEVCDVVLCVGHMANVIKQYFGDGSALGTRVRYAVERQLLGTAGAILNARPLLADAPLLAMNGDTLIPGLDYAALMREHASSRAGDPTVLGTLTAVAPPDAGQYGSLDLDHDGKTIIAFREKAPVIPGQALISGGVYVLETEIFDLIAPGRPMSIEYEVFPSVLKAGRKLHVYRHEGFFGDIGTPDGWERVRRHLC
jgi:NDP-sugar pyrophosphorylase family protein